MALCFMYVFGLAACSAAPAASGASPESASFGQEVSDVDLGDLVSNMVFSGSGNENGDYEIVDFPNRVNLTYIDYATQQQVVLCNRPECYHDDDTCAGIISCTENIPKPCTWKDKLVLVYPGNPFFCAEFGDAALPKIELMNADGSGKKLVHEFQPNEELSNSFAMDDCYIYVIKNVVEQIEESGIKSEKVIERIDLNTGESSIIYSEPSSFGTLTLIGCYADQLLFISIETSNPNLIGTPEDDSVNTLFGLSRRDGQRTEFMTWKRGELSDGAYGNQYLYLKSDGSINSLNFDTGEHAQLVDKFDGGVDESIFDLYVDGCLYIEVDSILFDADGTSVGIEMKRHQLNLETGETQELTLTAPWHGEQRPIQIIAEMENDLLVISNIEAYTASVVGEDGILYEEIVELQEYALISISDFVQSVPNYRVIEKML